MSGPVDLEALDRLAERATRGPWRHYNEVFRPQFGSRRITEIQRQKDGLTLIAWMGFDGLRPAASRKANHNAALCVALVNAYPALSTELRAARQEIAKLKACPGMLQP